MAESNFNCSFGEGTCNPKPAITKNEQHALLKKYILPWLNSQLKNDCAASQLLNSQLNSDLKITFQNECDFCVLSELPSNLTREKTGKVFPNPFNQQLMLSSQLCSESDFACVLQSMDGRNVLSKTFSQNYFSNHPIQLNTADITPGLYILKIMGRHKSETYLLRK